MIMIATHMTSTFLLVILLLEVLVLHSLVLPIKLCFTIRLALVLELVGLEVLLYHIGTRSLMASRPSLVTPSVRFEMQRSGSFPLAKIPRIESPETPSFNEKVSIANGTVD